MSPLRHGCLPSSSLLKAARTCVIGSAVLVAGCAANKDASYVNGPGIGSGQQMAAAPRKVEIEDDGQPVQPPPARIMSPAEDDPSQPWSPNYGKGVIPQPLPQRTPTTRLPRDMEAAVPAPIPAGYGAASQTSTGSVKKISATEADVLVAQAMSLHEMRKR